ncbi:MAG: CpsD/CapB family tyrosine-protein kinase [Planctomycetota bacterium]
MSTTTSSRPTPAAARRPPAIASETFSQVHSLAQRIQVLLPKPQAGGHIVGVTSCVHREGVSVVAENLAVCAAGLCDGKILLVDANSQRASVASRFGVPQTPGLTECLAGELAVRECIAETAHANLWVLPAGESVRRSARFSDEHTAEVFGDLRQGFELIVIDLPPIGGIDELFIASQLADGLLLVLEAERVRRQVAQRVVRQMQQADARLLGVVLNKRKNHIPEWLYRRL